MNPVNDPAVRAAVLSSITDDEARSLLRSKAVCDAFGEALMAKWLGEDDECGKAVLDDFRAVRRSPDPADGRPALS